MIRLRMLISPMADRDQVLSLARRSIHRPGHTKKRRAANGSTASVTRQLKSYIWLAYNAPHGSMQGIRSSTIYTGGLATVLNMTTLLIGLWEPKVDDTLVVQMSGEWRGF